MLTYFRLNDPYRLIGLLVIFLVIYLPLLIDSPEITYPELKAQIIGAKISDGHALYTGIIDYTSPLTGWVYAATDFVFGASLTASRVLGFIMLFIQTALLAIVFIERRAFPESSFIPPLIFAILSAFSFDTLALSGNLFATLFLLLAIASLFREIESREPGFEMVQRIGLSLGIATLFEFSFIVYVVGVLIIQLLFTRASGRKLLLLVVAFLIPHLLLIAFYSIGDGAENLWRFYYVPNLSFVKSSAVNWKTVMILAIIPLLFFLGALVTLNRESRFTKYQSQLVQAMFFLTIFGIVQAYYSNDMRPQSFLPAMVGFSFFISHFFAITIRRRFTEILFWCFALGTIGISYLHRYQVINDDAYQSLFVQKADEKNPKGRKVVALYDNLPAYSQNELATPFLNWKLSEEIFAEHEYYKNIILVANGFKNDMPEVVLDPDDKLKPFLDKIPELRSQFTRTDIGYERRKP